MEFRKYAEKNFVVFPVKIDKAPAIPKEVVSWKDIENSMDYKEYFKNDNIAIITGKKNKITVLDIDIEVDEIKNEFLKVLEDYPTPIMRRGNRNRIPSRFYAYNGEGNECLMMNFMIEGENKTKSSKVIEILGDGRYCVLPPTIRDDGTSFEWVGKDLLDMDLDHLPCINKDMIARFKVIINKYNVNPIKVASGEIGEGRNSKLFELMSAKVGNGVSKEEAINEVIEYDLKHHDNPWTLDRDEPHGSNQKKVLKYLSDMFDRILKKDLINHFGEVKVKDIEFNLAQNGGVFEINLVDKIEIARRPLPCLRGIGHEMFQHAYDASYVARSHFTFPAVISIASILMGNKIKFQGIHPNIYCLLAGGSGSGKSSAMDFIKEFLQESDLDQKLLGDGSPSGDTALMQNLPIQRERIDILDEGDSLFLTINSANAYGKKVADVYASLFTSSGKYFAGKNSSAFKGKGNEMGNIGGCFSPYVNLIMGITFKAFEQSVTESVVDKGFGARILYFADNEKKRKKTAKIKPIPKKFIDLAKLWSSLEKVEAKTMNLANPYAKKFEIKEAVISEVNQVILDKYLAELDERSFNEPQESKITALLERAGEYLKKMALIDAFLTQPNTTDLEITKCSLDWAMDFINVHLHNAKLFIDGYINQGLYNYKINKIYDYISFKKGVSRMTLSNNFQKIPKKERKELVQDLLEMGKIKEVDKLLFKV